MKNHFEALSQNLLFKNLTKNEINTVLSHLTPRIIRYKQGSYIVMTGSAVNECYILLDGCVHLTYEDSVGKRVLMARYASGDTMMELFIKSNLSFLVALAVKNSVLAAISFEKVLTLPVSDKIWNKILTNVWSLSVKKKLMLYGHLIHASRPNIREKIISYLNEQKDKTGRNEFVLPLNKKDLADYLFINRQAMMKELAAMKKDKIIDFKGLRFILKTANQ